MEALYWLLQCHVYFRATCIGLLIMPMIISQPSRADGSKDLIRNGGYRPFLEGGHGRTVAGINRMNKFYVYLRAGETLQLGSSAMGMYEGDIQFTQPDGTTGSCLALKPATAGDRWGIIPSIDEERAGPLPNVGGYTACERAADASTEGIWEVTFVGPAPDSWAFSTPLPAGASWQQAPDVYTIAAWDITVRNADTQEVPGRVFANHLPLNLGSATASIASTLFARTRDGYDYRIDLNNISGHTLLLFANSAGFQTVTEEALLYRSIILDPLNTSNNGLPDGVKLHNPFMQDTEQAATHKLFLVPPADDLPVAAMQGDVPVWLANPVVAPATFDGLSYTGSVGKTGSFSFQASAAGRYLLTIDLNQNGIWGDGTDTFLSGVARAGENIVPWNGNDASGFAVNGVAGGYQARVVALAGEIHLPALDFENQVQGIVLERQNGAGAPAYTVYYNDAALEGRPGAPEPVNGLGGADSRAGAHPFAEAFGDAAGVDTWSYVASSPAYLDESLFPLVNDLRVAVELDTQVPADNQAFVHLIRVANDGPDDAQGIRVRVNMPATFQIQLADAPEGNFSPGERIWFIDQLPSGDEAVLTLTLLAPSGGAYTLFSEVIAHAGDDPDSTPNNFDERLPNQPAEDDTQAITVYVAPEPSLGLAQQVSLITDDPAGFKAQFDVLVENLGNTPLSSVQVLENLTARFQGTDFRVVAADASAPLVINPNYDGDLDTNLLESTQSVLGVGEQGAITYVVDVTPFANLGPYTGNANGFAEGLTGVVVEDISDDGLITDLNKDGLADGSEENDPSVINIDTRSSIGLAMQVSNVTGTAASFSADYTLMVENLGNVPLQQVQIINDLGGLFGPGNTSISNLSVDGPLAINATFDGQAVDDMLDAAASNLGVGERATLSFSLEASPAFSLGFFNHVARATAQGPDGRAVFDLSDDGEETDPNGNGRANDPGEEDVTVIAFEGAPSIGVSLFATQVTGDLGGFGVYYDIEVRNLGDTVLNSVQLLEDLGRAFEGTNFSVSNLTATQPLAVNPDFDGLNDKNLLARFGNSLAPNASAKISFTVDVEPVSSFGPYSNSVIAYADTPAGTTTSDTSDNGTTVDADNDGNANEPGENDHSITAFAPTGHLGVALGLAATTGDLNTFRLVYTMVAENLGDVPLSGLSLEQDLEAALAGTSYRVVRVTPASPFEANPLFDGGQYQELLAPTGAELGVGQQVTVEVELEVIPVDNFGPYALHSMGAARTPFGTTLQDESTSGLNPDPNNNGDPTEEGENEPGVLVLTERPVIGVSMAALPADGDLKGFTSRYVLRVENLGDVPLENVSVTTDLAQTFAGTSFDVLKQSVQGPLALNKDFDGVEHTELLAGESRLVPGDTARVLIDLAVLPVDAVGPFSLSAIASATGPNGSGTTDISANGFVVDSNGNGVPNEADENEPTVLDVAAMPAIGVAKVLNELVEVSDGFEASFSVTLQNVGDVLLRNVQVADPLADAFPAADIDVQTLAVIDGDAYVPAANYDGVSQVNLLEDNLPDLPPGEDVILSYVVKITPDPAAQQGGEDLFLSQATATATDPAGNVVTDLSNAGTDPDPNGNGNAGDAGEDEPTQVDAAFRPALYVNAFVEDIAGDTTRFDALVSFKLENTGAVKLDSLDFSFNLMELFPGAIVTVQQIWTTSESTLPVNATYDGLGDTRVLVQKEATLTPGASARIKVLVTVTPGASRGPYKSDVEITGRTKRGQIVYGLAKVPPLRIATSTGEEAGLESNGDLASLVSQRNYRTQHTSWIQSVAKAQATALPRLSALGADAVEGTGSLNAQDVIDLVPTEGPRNSDGVVTTPKDLFGITNATSVLAVDYMDEDARLAALFATTSPVDELYDHTKNICDRLKGASLESVSLISIKGHPFVLSVLEHDNGEVDYAINFVGYRQGANYLIDSRFVRDAYQIQTSVTGEILNFQVWSYNPQFTIALVEDILNNMETVGSIGFVSREDDIPQIPDVFVERGSYQAGQLVFQLRKPAGVTEFIFKGETTNIEGGEKSVFERVIPVTGNATDEEQVEVVLPSGVLFDALLTVTNDANTNVDQIYIADGPWGKIEDAQEDTDIEVFEILEQPSYNPSDGRFVIERGAAVSGTVADSLVVFRHFRPGGRAIDLSTFSYVSFTAAGTGTAQLRLEEANAAGDFFTKDIELEASPKNYTIVFEDFSKRNGQSGFQGQSTSAISFSFHTEGSEPMPVTFTVESLVFGKGQPTNLETDGLIPTVYSLDQNYPNPFNPSTTISFGLPEPASVSLQVFDMLGRQVLTAVEQDYNAGRHKVVLDASRLASGAYIYRMQANKEVFTKIMHVVK
ncbi:MAG: T9SS type A sorting domain-containing protein [Bacteroidota bacterium]